MKVVGQDTAQSRPGVLMVTGAYYPELSGAGLQCRSLVQALAGDVDFSILTTTTNRRLPARDTRDGVGVMRVFVDPSSVWSRTVAALRIIRAFAAEARRFSIVHLHGFSSKSILIVVLALLGGKKIALKLTSFGDDDPLSIRRRGWLTAWCYRRANLFLAVSPRFVESYAAAGLPSDRLLIIANGVDLQRFRPVHGAARAALRRDLGLPADALVVLFVGFFSREKQPHVLFDAWAEAVAATSPDAVLQFVGATRSSYHEVDETLVDDIRARAAALGLATRVRFVEQTLEIERFHGAADIFVLPSLREGLPNALLEAMSCGAACIATRLAGITDHIITGGENGVLVPPGDGAALARALAALAADPGARARMGAEARRTIEARYALSITADSHLRAYRRLLGRPPCAA